MEKTEQTFECNCCGEIFSTDEQHEIEWKGVPCVCCDACYDGDNPATE